MSIEAEKQDPVGWTHAANLVDDGYGHIFSVHSSEPAYDDWVPLYTAPPQKPWVSLTEDEIWKLVWQENARVELARAIEAKLKEKNS